MRRQVVIRSVFTCLIVLAGAATVTSGACDTALLVIDMQNEFLGWHPWMTSTGQDIVAALEELVTLARGAGVLVIYIQDISLDPEQANPDTLAIASEIAPQAGEAVFTKLSGDALSNRELAPYLEDNGIQRLLLSGIASDGCVQATLVSAYRAGYDIFVITDAHAHRDGSPESAEQRNEYWLGLDLEGQPMAEVNWEAFGCVAEEEGTAF